MHYNFDWDPAKEKSNRHKHKISFRRAVTVFRDPKQLSVFDEEHSEVDDRWITIGLDTNGILCVVVHTYEQIDENYCEIRIISARKAAASEAQQYEEGY